MIGTTLSHYRITAKLGEGGMGEVYRAEDTRLDREVAIKVLPQSVAESPQFHARFEREARTISSLNHPHICTLYDIGEEDGIHFLVMELLEGESLAQRLEKGLLPLDQVFKYGAQIAEALETAHKQGIVHRDLKPGNVMLTKVGAKLLDFGLARAAVKASPLQGLSHMPTEEQPLTAEGTIVGTFQYMAPEQLEGLEADARTDIFALGALLYEMATGNRAFEAETRTSLIAAIVASQPQPISKVLPVSHPALDHTVSRCLEKEPDDRWQSAHDVASELSWIAEQGSQVDLPLAVATPRKLMRRRFLLAFAAFGWLVALASGLWLALAPGAVQEHEQVFRADLVEPEKVPYAHVSRGNIRLSPEGDRLTYLTGKEGAGGEGIRVIVVRNLVTGDVTVLDNTDGATFPFWSPDGRWIGFFADRKLKKIPSEGGPVQILSDAAQGRGGSWGRQGDIVFSPDLDGPLMLIAQDGGATRQITEWSEEFTYHRNPHFLPDGKHFLFNQRLIDTELWDIALGSIDGGQSRIVANDGLSPQWADGYLLFVRGSNLLAQVFDMRALKAEGSAVALADTIALYGGRGLANFSESNSGLLAYRQQRPRETQLAWFDERGAVIETIGDANMQGQLRVSADASTAALVRCEPATQECDIWVLDLETRNPTRATSLRVRSLAVAISPSGDRLAIFNQGELSLAVLTLADGSRQPLVEGVHFSPEDWSADGRYLIGVSYSPQSSAGRDITYFDFESPAELHDFVATKSEEFGARLSPDGRWIAYISNETGTYKIFVSDFPAHRRKWMISQGGSPLWSQDGHSLFFTSASSFFKIAVGGEQSPQFGPPQLVMTPEDAAHIWSLRAQIDDRFLGQQNTGDTVSEPVRLIRNWQLLLKR